MLSLSIIVAIEVNITLYEYRLSYFDCLAIELQQLLNQERALDALRASFAQ